MDDVSRPKDLQAKCEALAVADRIGDQSAVNPNDPVRDDLRARVITSNVIDEVMREELSAPDSFYRRSYPEGRFSALKELRAQCDGRPPDDARAQDKHDLLSRRGYAPCAVLESARVRDDAVAAGTADPLFAESAQEYKKLAAEGHLKRSGKQIPPITESGDGGARAEALQDLRSRCFAPPIKP